MGSEEEPNAPEDDQEPRDQRTGGVNGDNGVTRLIINIAGCCLERKAIDDGSVDRAEQATAFDPTEPNGEYRCTSREHTFIRTSEGRNEGIVGVVVW